MGAYSTGWVKPSHTYIPNHSNSNNNSSASINMDTKSLRMSFSAGQVKMVSRHGYWSSFSKPPKDRRPDLKDNDNAHANTNNNTNTTHTENNNNRQPHIQSSLNSSLSDSFKKVGNLAYVRTYIHTYIHINMLPEG